MIDLFSYFHVYGLLIGVGFFIAITLCEMQAKKYHFPENIFWQLVFSGIVGGVVGARLYHVFTDWQLYKDFPLATFFIWQGGLSIIGGVIGGAISSVFVVWVKKIPFTVLQTGMDLAVFGLPIGQSIGRLGNWWNQEVYGLPTLLPWGIWISPDRRLPGYEMYARYHPLFAYEISALLFFAAILWWREKRSKNPWQVGRGKLFFLYLLYYSILRFSLDFVRLEKTMFFSTSFSFNQVVMVVGVIFSIIGLRYAHRFTQKV